MKTDLIEKLEKLPDDVQKEVEDFVDFLIYKKENKDELNTANNIVHEFSTEKNLISVIVRESNVKYCDSPKPKREAGRLKGKIWMSDDFDEPLEEFKD